MKIKLETDFFYQIKNDDNFKELIKEINSCQENVERNNNMLEFYAGEWVKIKINDYITHIVKPTETLESIAMLYNKNKAQIALDNALVSEKLFIGQMLKIK